MKILVTGADGFLGSNIVRELLSRNHQVIGFLLKNSDHQAIDGLDIEKRYGNLLDAHSLVEHSKDCDAMIHTAAVTDVWPARNPISWKVNFEGTKNVVEAVQKNNLKRLVYVGTANTFGFGSKQNPGNEKTPYAGGKYNLDYMDSKLEAHKLVEKEAKAERLPAVIVNPTFMLGPYDVKPGPGALLQAIQKGTLPGFAPGGRNILSVKAAATAIANALTKGTVGESHILAGDNLNYKELFELMADIAGVKPPKFTLPKLALMLYGNLGSIMAGITGNKPTVSKEMAMISCDEHFFSSTKAQAEIDLPVVSARQSIQECYDWFIENGYLPDPSLN